MIKKVESFFKEYAPIENSQRWDNTGTLICARKKEIELENNAYNLLLTNDITKSIVDEAIKTKCHCIVSYHPILFKGIKKLTDEILIDLVKNSIDVYSPHTALDKKMCLKMVDLLGSLIVEKVTDTYVVCTQNESVDGNIHTYLHALNKLIFNEKGETFIRYVIPSDILLSEINFRCSSKIIIGMGAAQEDFKKEITCGDGIDGNNGLGLIITGEMTHHDILYYKQNNVCVILLEHSNSERFYLKYLKEDMIKSDELKGVEILVSKNDKDPISYFYNCNN